MRIVVYVIGDRNRRLRGRSESPSLVRSAHERYVHVRSVEVLGAVPIFEGKTPPRRRAPWCGGRGPLPLRLVCPPLFLRSFPSSTCWPSTSSHRRQHDDRREIRGRNIDRCHTSARRWRSPANPRAISQYQRLTCWSSGSSFRLPPRTVASY